MWKMLILSVILQTPLPGMRGVPKNLPDISAIGNLMDALELQNGEHIRNLFEIRELELAFQGYLYPSIKSSAIVAFHKHDEEYHLEIHELFVEFLKILPGLKASIGREFINLGIENRIHEHHRVYADTPFILEKTFGEHPVAGDGLLISYLLPVQFFLQLESGIWWLMGEEEEEEEEETYTFKKEAFTGRLSTSFPIGENGELGIGGSFIYGKGNTFEEGHPDWIRVYGGDIRFRYWGSGYKKFLVQSEYLYGFRKTPECKTSRNGAYILFNYQWSKNWDVGTRIDFVLDEGERISAFLTRHLTETTYLRSQYTFQEGNHTLYIQIVFGIGPHAHPLQ